MKIAKIFPTQNGWAKFKVNVGLVAANMKGIVYAKGRHALKLREELKKHVIKQGLTSECYWPNIKRTSKKGGSENGWPELLRKRRDTNSLPSQPRVDRS